MRNQEDREEVDRKMKSRKLILEIVELGRRVDLETTGTEIGTIVERYWSWMEEDLLDRM
jgi:hypothetical protein